jgi:lipopolysaccharide/colanic/teichoic acid biosynthesis glycosyltransferase
MPSSRKDWTTAENRVIYSKMMRRLVDCISALSLLALTGPFQLLISILIKMDSSGPVFYTPEMVGKDGRAFRLFRFRTMRVDSGNSSPEGQWTRVGIFIRNYSLDHLPMLLNLLKGDLTLIGPRPMEREAVNMQSPVWQEYFRVKPGLINSAVLALGSAWTSTRMSHPALNQEIEIEYLRGRSTWSDLELFWKAVRAYFRSQGNVKARGKPVDAVQQRLNE